MVGALVVIWVVFSALTDGTFLSPRNLTLLARQMSVTSVLAIGMVLVIVAGQIDLSVGAVAGLAGALSAMACTNRDWPLAAALVAVLMLGGAAGAAQGALVAKLGVPAFIVTLGGMLIFQGTLLGVTGGASTTPPRSYLALGQSFVPKGVGWALAGAFVALALYKAARAEGAARRLRWIALVAAALAFAAVMNGYQGVPLPVLLVLVLAAVLSGVAQHTPFGRHLYAIGGNREAAYYAGISIQKHIVGVFTLMGALSAVAGVVLTARVGAATSDAGRMMELDAIAAAVIGGTSLLGGQGTVWGALVGAAVMASLDNGMSLLNTESFWQPIIKGAILVAAVAADMAGRRRG
jgi:D-xylose transport system permease protein